MPRLPVRSDANVAGAPSSDVYNRHPAPKPRVSRSAFLIFWRDCAEGGGHLVREDIYGVSVRKGVKIQLSLSHCNFWDPESDARSNRT